MTMKRSVNQEWDRMLGVMAFVMCVWLLIIGAAVFGVGRWLGVW